MVILQLGTDLDDRVHRLGVLSGYQVSGAAKGLPVNNSGELAYIGVIPGRIV